MKKKTIIALLLLAALTGVYAATQIFKYRCPYCGLIQIFSCQQINPKCPNDGQNMFREYDY